MTSIILKNNKGFSWYTEENIFIKGSFFDSDNNYYEKEIQPSYYDIYIQKIKERIKPFFPYKIIKRYLIKNDWLNSEFITKQMIISMKKNNLPIHSKITAYNDLNIQWYLYFCQGLIKNKH